MHFLTNILTVSYQIDQLQNSKYYLSNIKYFFESGPFYILSVVNMKNRGHYKHI